MLVNDGGRNRASCWISADEQLRDDQKDEKDVILCRERCHIIQLKKIVNASAKRYRCQLDIGELPSSGSNIGLISRARRLDISRRLALLEMLSACFYTAFSEQARPGVRISCRIL